ncbi:MAG: hypothetical protein ACJASB_000492 [Shewanella psychromarinicola]|jgi:hypothetical protein
MIKRVGNTNIELKHKATCHCGAVELELTLQTASKTRDAVIVQFVVEKVPLLLRLNSMEFDW